MVLNSQFCAQKKIENPEVRFCAQIEFPIRTNLRFNEPGIINVLEFRSVLNFEHGSGNLIKLATLLRHNFKSKMGHFAARDSA